MHHMTKKSLIAEYGKLSQQGASMVEVKNALTEARKELTPEEVDEIVLEIFNDPEHDPVADTQSQLAPASNTIRQDPDKPHHAAGKKRYDIYRGKWTPKKVTQGFDGKDFVLVWRFVPEGKPTKTGVPMEPEKAELFNASRRIRAGNTITEQLIEVGFEGDILDTLPNPFAVRDVTL
jgi:hypothetical protein